MTAISRATSSSGLVMCDSCIFGSLTVICEPISNGREVRSRWSISRNRGQARFQGRPLLDVVLANRWHPQWDGCPP